MYDIWQYFPISVRQQTAATFDAAINTPDSVGYNVPDIIEDGTVYCPLGYALHQLGANISSAPTPLSIVLALHELGLVTDYISIVELARAFTNAHDNLEIYNIYGAMGIPRP